MFSEKVKEGLIVGAQVGAAVLGVAATAAVTAGLDAVLPSGGTIFKKVVTKVGISAAGYGVGVATVESMNKTGLNTIAIIDKIGDKIIENRKNKPVKEKKVKKHSIKDRNIFKKRANKGA